MVLPIWGVALLALLSFAACAESDKDDFTDNGNLPDFGNLPDDGNPPDDGNLPDSGNPPDVGDSTPPTGLSTIPADDLGQCCQQSCLH